MNSKIGSVSHLKIAPFMKISKHKVPPVKTWPSSSVKDNMAERGLGAPQPACTSLMPSKVLLQRGGLWTGNGAMGYKRSCGRKHVGM